MPGQIRTRRSQTSNPRRRTAFQLRSGAGFSLVELLCVIAIIGILASLLLPTLSRAYDKARGMAQEMEAPGIFGMVRDQTRAYCAAHPQYLFLSKSELMDKVGFAPKPHDWVQSSRTEFVPFGYLDDTNKVALTFHFGRRYALVHYLTKGDLTVTPPE